MSQQLTIVRETTLFRSATTGYRPEAKQPTVTASDESQYIASDTLLSCNEIPREIRRFEIELGDPIDLGDGTYLRRKKPLLVKVERDTEGLHSSAADISFDDLVEDYEELISTTNAMCVLLWREYAQASDEDLTDDALELKRRILRDFEVAEIASKESEEVS